MSVGLRSASRGALGASLALTVLLTLSPPARAAGGVFDSSGAVQVVGATVVVTAGAVEELDLRWKLSKDAQALAVVVPIPGAVVIQSAGSGSAHAAANTTAPQRKSFLLRPWVLAGEGTGDAISARDALQADTQEVRVNTSSVVSGDGLATALGGAVPGMSSSVARVAAASVALHSLPGSRYAVALLEPTSGRQFQAGWVGTLRLAVRGVLQSTSSLPGADGGRSASVDVPLPGGVLGAQGPQVVAVTADTQMRAAAADNVAPVVTGVDRTPQGRWQSVMYGQGAGQAAAVDVVEATDDSGAFHAVEPALLPEFSAWPWILGGAAILVMAIAVLLRGIGQRRAGGDLRRSSARSGSHKV